MQSSVIERINGHHRVTIKSHHRSLKPAKLFFTVYCPPDTDYENRAPVIFVHGLAATNGTWKSVREIIGLKTKRKIICLDIRNHGKSEWPDAFTLDLTVLDLENFMEEQQIPKAIFLGHSLGGRMALGLAFKRPELVEKLILEDTFLRLAGTWTTLLTNSQMLAQAIKTFPKTLSEKEAKELIWKNAETLFPEHIKTMRGKMDSLVQFYKDKKTGLFKCYFDLDVHSKISNLEFDLSNNPTYNGETLVMVADNSNFITKSDVEELRKLLPNSQEVTITGCTHALHVENQAKFIEVTSKFINGVSLQN